MQSQILHSLDSIAIMYANTHRKKGTAALKTPPQAQPDYVIEAKKGAKEQKKEESAQAQQDLAELFEKRNNKVKNIEEVLKCKK